MSTDVESNTSNGAQIDTGEEEIQVSVKTLKLSDDQDGKEEEEDIMDSNEEDDCPDISATTLSPLDFSMKHPLQNRWTIWYDNPGKKTSQASWADNLKKIVTFDTVEDFWRIFNNIRPSSKLLSGSNYHVFKENVEPKWEHPENKQGGKWVVASKNKKDFLDKIWLWTVLACIGENLEEDNEICGCVVSIRKQGDRVALWTKHATNEPAQRHVGASWKKALELPDTFIVGFQSHSDCLKRNSSFNNRNRYEL